MDRIVVLTIDGDFSERFTLERFHGEAEEYYRETGDSETLDLIPALERGETIRYGGGTAPIFEARIA